MLMTHHQAPVLLRVEVTHDRVEMHGFYWLPSGHQQNNYASSIFNNKRRIISADISRKAPTWVCALEKGKNGCFTPTHTEAY
jgi:hypothetical protein